MKKLIYLLLALACLVSCKKFVTIPTPKNQITTAQVFADSADALAAILNVYIKSNGLSSGINGYGMSLLPGLSADEILQTGNNTDYNEFYVNNILVSNNADLALWNSAYISIYNANACITGISESTGISPNAKLKLIAEAKFIRAFELFYLVNMYGAVPVPLSTDYNTNAVLSRMPANEVYSQIITDLSDAENGLPNFSGTNTRPTDLAASALLAKVYLYSGKYDLAKSEASKVINSGSFMLEPELNTVFTINSREVIWQLASIIPNEGSGDGLIFVPSSPGNVPRYVIRPTLYQSFESGDLRKSAWIDTSIVQGISYPYPYKYKQGYTTGEVNEYEVLIRFADLFLIRAEAENYLDDLADANADLTVIRHRAGLGNSSSTTKAGLLIAVQNERRWEFFCERGNRWFDLKRWGTANLVLQPLKANWDVNDVLYPIPASQINYDPNLNQNPGY